jgi:hypothetical protein
MGGRKFYLSVIKLRNFVIGNDFGVFEITTKQPDERARIEQLLSAVESSGLTFVRNGKASTASEAAAHLRRKWVHTKPAILTANGFIERIASRSSITGEKYEVRLADESVVDADTWLRQQLEHIDQEQAE